MLEDFIHDERWNMPKDPPMDPINSWVRIIYTLFKIVLIFDKGSGMKTLTKFFFFKNALELQLIQQYISIDTSLLTLQQIHHQDHH